MNLTIKGEANIPERVWAVGFIRTPETHLHHHPPIRDEETGAGVAPLSILDTDGERALPVFTTRHKAERGIVHFMTEEERTQNIVGAAIVHLDTLLETMRQAPPGTPAVDYIGVDMGEGGYYPLLRLYWRGAEEGLWKMLDDAPSVTRMRSCR